jgi:exosortase
VIIGRGTFVRKNWSVRRTENIKETFIVRNRNFNIGSISVWGQVAKRLKGILGFAVFGVLWYMLIAQLSQYWAVDAQYSFGWVVPLLCAYLFLTRWRSRPAPLIAASPLARWIFLVAGFALLPTWVIGQPNPDWRFISWLLATETVALSLGAIYFVGGTSWLRHFTFSICLIFVAVPWPSAVEEPVIQTLTQASAALPVAVLNLFHVYAVQHGNLIELKTGLVGIDEACSGIRSLQAAFMMSVFLGELYRTSVLRRYALALCSVLIAIGCNAVRTLMLTIVAAKEGTASIAIWHDPLGYALMTTCFLLIWGMGRVISGPFPAFAPATAKASGAPPYRLVFGLGGWILCTLVLSEIWYRAHQKTETPQWSVVWPVYKQGFADLAISRPEADSLLFDKGRGAEWTNEDGSHWVAYFFRWVNGASRSRILARGHRPEICFPAAGYQPCGDHGTITLEAKGFSIPFRALDFENEGDKQYVFFCLWEEGLKSSQQPWIKDTWSRLSRLRSVVVGERNLAQQTLEIVISGYDNHQKAEAAFRREIVTLIEASGSERQITQRNRTAATQTNGDIKAPRTAD